MRCGFIVRFERTTGCYTCRTVRLRKVAAGYVADRFLQKTGCSSHPSCRKGSYDSARVAKLDARPAFFFLIAAYLFGTASRAACEMSDIAFLSKPVT